MPSLAWSPLASQHRSHRLCSPGTPSAVLFNITWCCPPSLRASTRPLAPFDRTSSGTHPANLHRPGGASVSQRTFRMLASRGHLQLRSCVRHCAPSSLHSHVVKNCRLIVRKSCCKVRHQRSTNHHVFFSHPHSKASHQATEIAASTLGSLGMFKLYLSALYAGVTRFDLLRA